MLHGNVLRKRCSSNSGCLFEDYIVDMETFLYAWMESKEVYQSFKCDYLKSYVCSCDEANENYSQDMCLYDCYKVSLRRLLY
jgi:hypothetical protein